MFNTKNLISISVLAGAMLVSTNVFAWGSYGGHTSYGSGDGNEWSYQSYEDSSNYSDVKVSAWSDSSSDKKLKQVELKHGDDGYKVDNNHSNDDDGDYTKECTKYSMHGCEEYKYTENHYIENKNYTDSVMFDYGDKCVVLNEVVLGGYKNDADVAVFAYLGSKKGDEFKSYMAGKSYDDLIASNEWKVFNVDDVDKTYYKKKKFNEDEKVAASQWLVMANHKKDGDDDYFRIKHMGGYGHTYSDNCYKVVECEPSTSVPAPHSLALLGLGLIGVVATRRRKQ